MDSIKRRNKLSTYKTENIFNTTLEILNSADVNKITTHTAALQIAQQRIATRKMENEG